MPWSITPKSGSKGPTVKVTPPKNQGSVRYPLSPQKGTQNPPHYHIKIKKPGG